MAAKRLTDAVIDEAGTVVQLEADAELARLRSKVATLEARYKAALTQIDRERERADAMVQLRDIKPARQSSAKAGKRRKHDATMMVLLSDWHVEERVDPATCNGLNNFSLDVCDLRIAELTERFLAMLEHERHLARIDRVIVWLGGDFLSGHIHPDTAELAQLAPLAATRWAGERLRAFIDAVAANAREVIVATSNGNHGRSNAGERKPRIGTEAQHSYEHALYVTMAAAEPHKHVHWKVSESYLNYIDVDGFKIRAHHGHGYSFSGGIGGIHVPVSKANAAWQAIERADLTVFGHWHQWSWLRAGRYVSNGSLIGHNAYAVRIKAAYEPPCQAAIVIDHGRNEVTNAFPIFCDRDLRRA